MQPTAFLRGCHRLVPPVSCPRQSHSLDLAAARARSGLPRGPFQIGRTEGIDADATSAASRLRHGLVDVRCRPRAHLPVLGCDRGCSIGLAVAHHQNRQPMHVLPLLGALPLFRPLFTLPHEREPGTWLSPSTFTLTSPVPARTWPTPCSSAVEQPGTVSCVCSPSISRESCVRQGTVLREACPPRAGFLLSICTDRRPTTESPTSSPAPQLPSSPAPQLPSSPAPQLPSSPAPQPLSL
jgi:hypothetical protein